jgi:mutator protein MutT
VIRRAAGIAKGGYWCFPGGHLEPGETSRQAIQRELAEELGIRIRPIQRVGSIRVLDSKYILAVWRVEHTSGEFHPAKQEIAEIRWLLPEEVRAIEPGLPSTARVMDMLEA